MLHKNSLKLCFLLLSTYHFVTLYAGRSSSGRSSASSGRRTGGYYGGSYYGGGADQQTATQISPQTPKEYLDEKSGFSTFGIISIIFAVILSCLIFYYGIICYPFLCRDEKKYRYMDGSSTITAATSRSIQSIENFPVDQKHQCV